jgi:hypothetical protein
VAVVLLCVGLIATFIHKVFPSKDVRQKAITQERTDLKAYWNATEAKHDSLLQVEAISIPEYLKQKQINESQRIADFKALSKKRIATAEDFGFNGRSSANFWFWIFGTHLMLLIISCYSAFKDIRLKQAGLLKWYEPVATISYIAVSLFLLYHTIFLESRDFQFSTYTLVLVLVIIPFSIFLYYSIRSIVLLEEKLLSNIRDLVSHVLYNTKEDKEKEKWEVLEKVAKNGE